MSTTTFTTSSSSSCSTDVLRIPAASGSSSSATPASSSRRRVNEDALSNLSVQDRVLFAQYGLGARRRVDIPLVHNGFERHVRTQPDAVAVEHSLFHHSLTYAQLDRHANRLAHRLRDQGIAPGARVVVLARRSIYYVVAVLAVLKAGGQYVPIDAVTVTDDTLAHILSDSKATICVVMEEYESRVHGTPKLVLENVIREDEMKDAPATKPDELARPEDGCYVIYTSGTTGKPKGVDVRHKGVSNVICASPGNVGMRPGMRVAQLLNIAFDMGAWETLGSLYNGATLCLRGNTSKEWASLLKTVDVVISTPSILTRHDPAQYPTIKHVIVGGEPCPQALADRWARYCAFNNCCGPTEISIMNTVQRHNVGYPLSIGTPIPNTNVYILGRDPMDTTPAAIGVVGCMWVGGTGVSNGYLGLPEKTAERWRPDPFVGGGAMMFNTGDLGVWRSDGQLDHRGRADDQVKVKGFRVELDGVGAALCAHPPVTDAVALLVGTELWGFVAPADVDLAAVRAAAARSQPYYAVPSQYLALPSFPHTKNGKVDKRALRELAECPPPATPATPGAPPPPVVLPAVLPSAPTPSKSAFPVLPSPPQSPMFPAYSMHAAQSQPQSAPPAHPTHSFAPAHSNNSAHPHPTLPALNTSADSLRPPAIEITPGTPQRLTVPNGGVPYRASLPGTPYIPPATPEEVNETNRRAGERGSSDRNANGNGNANAKELDVPQWSPDADRFMLATPPGSRRGSAAGKGLGLGEVVEERAEFGARAQAGEQASKMEMPAARAVASAAPNATNAPAPAAKWWQPSLSTSTTAILASAIAVAAVGVLVARRAFLASGVASAS